MTWFQELPTGKWILVDVVNTRVTKTSLFDGKQEGAWYGPGGELTGRGLWLVYSGPKANVGPSKRTLVHLWVHYL